MGVALGATSMLQGTRTRPEVVVPAGWLLPIFAAGALTLGSSSIARADWSWVSAAPMSDARWRRTAARLPLGKVLVTGGYMGNACIAASQDPFVGVNPPAPADSATPSSAIYDALADAWTPAASTLAAHGSNNAVTLEDGRVMVGDLSAGKPSEINDATTDTWHATAPSPSTGSGNTRSLLLTSGDVLLIQGRSMEIYLPATDT